MSKSTSNQPQLKVCTKCGVAKPATAECFHRNKNTKDGLVSHCKRCANAATQEWREAHRDRDRANAMRWYKNNPKRAKNTRKQWVINNRAKHNQRNRQWANNHPEYEYERHRRARIASPERNRLYAKRHNARKKELLCDLTQTQWEENLAYFDYSCAFCGRPESEVGTLHQEHIVPVTQGGGYTKDNIIPACKSCNSRKWKRTPEQAGMKLRKPFPK